MLYWPPRNWWLFRIGKLTVSLSIIIIDEWPLGAAVIGTRRDWVSLQARGDADGALIKYKAMGAEFLEEQNAEIWSNLGLCFMRNKKLIAAISCLRKSIWTAPLNFNGLFNLGYVFMKGTSVRRTTGHEIRV